MASRWVSFGRLSTSVSQPPIMQKPFDTPEAPRGGPAASLLADDALRLTRLPDRDVQAAVADLYRRRADDVGHIEVVELLSSQVQSGLLEQVRDIAAAGPCPGRR